jgi:hypothetical protein
MSKLAHAISFSDKRSLRLFIRIPYESPKLAIVAQVTDQDFAIRLDKAIARCEQMRPKLIEQKLVEATEVEPEPPPTAPLRAPLTRIYSPKFRRF